MTLLSPVPHLHSPKPGSAPLKHLPNLPFHLLDYCLLNPGSSLLINLRFPSRLFSSPCSALLGQSDVFFSKCKSDYVMLPLKLLQLLCYFLGKAPSLLGPTKHHRAWPSSPPCIASEPAHGQCSLLERDLLSFTWVPPVNPLSRPVSFSWQP